MKYNTVFMYDTYTYYMCNYHMLAHGQIDQPGMHDLHGTRISKLPYALLKCKCDDCENFDLLL